MARSSIQTRKSLVPGPGLAHKVPNMGNYHYGSQSEVVYHMK